MKNCFVLILCCVLSVPIYAQFELQFSGNFLFNVDGFQEREFTSNIEGVIHAVYGIAPNHSLSIGGGFLVGDEHPAYGGEVAIGLPMLLNYNFGYGATRYAKPLIGGYAGIGFQTIKYNNLTQFNGYLFQAGFRTAHFLPETVRYTVLYDLKKQLFIRVFVNQENTNQRIVSCGIGFTLPG
jgi:hypothetical protein